MSWVQLSSAARCFFFFSDCGICLQRWLPPSFLWLVWFALTRWYSDSLFKDSSYCHGQWKSRLIWLGTPRDIYPENGKLIRSCSSWTLSPSIPNPNTVYLMIAIEPDCIVFRFRWHFVLKGLVRCKIRFNNTDVTIVRCKDLSQWPNWNQMLVGHICVHTWHSSLDLFLWVVVFVSLYFEKGFWK